MEYFFVVRVTQTVKLKDGSMIVCDSKSILLERHWRIYKCWNLNLKSLAWLKCSIEDDQMSFGEQLLAHAASDDRRKKSIAEKSRSQYRTQHLRHSWRCSWCSRLAWRPRASFLTIRSAVVSAVVSATQSAVVSATQSAVVSAILSAVVSTIRSAVVLTSW